MLRKAREWCMCVCVWGGGGGSRGGGDRLVNVHLLPDIWRYQPLATQPVTTLVYSFLVNRW